MFEISDVRVCGKKSISLEAIIFPLVNRDYQIKVIKREIMFISLNYSPEIIDLVYSIYF